MEVCEKVEPKDGSYATFYGGLEHQNQSPCAKAPASSKAFCRRTLSPDSPPQEEVTEQEQKMQVNPASRHLKQLIQYNRDLWSLNVMTDVELQAGNRIFKSHQSVVSCFSPYLKRKLIRPDGVQITKKLFVPRINENIFEILLRYMYTGELQLTCENFYEVYMGAAMLEMKSLIEECIEILRDNPNRVKVYFYMYVASKKMGNQEHWVRAYRLILNRFEEAIFTPDFLDLEVDFAVEILSGEQIGARSEVLVFMAALKWLYYRFEVRRYHAVRVVNCVRFCMMSAEEILSCFHPPILPQVLEIPEIAVMMLRATCYITAKLFGLEHQFKKFAGLTRILLLQGDPVELWTYISRPTSPSCKAEGNCNPEYPEHYSQIQSEGCSTPLIKRNPNYPHSPLVPRPQQQNLGNKVTFTTHEKSPNVSCGAGAPRGCEPKSPSAGGVYKDDFPESSGSYGMTRAPDIIIPPRIEASKRENYCSEAKTPLRDCRERFTPLGNIPEETVTSDERSRGGNPYGHSGHSDQRGPQSIVVTQVVGKDADHYERSLEKVVGSAWMDQSVMQNDPAPQKGKAPNYSMSSINCNIVSDVNLQQQKQHPRREQISSCSLPSSAFSLPSTAPSEFVRSKELPKILVLGGINPQKIHKVGIGTSVLSFDPHKNKWNRYSSLPKPRHHHCAAYLDGCVYVVGGCDVRETIQNEKFIPKASCFKLDLRTVTWCRIASMSHRRFDHGMVSIQGMLYVIGGQDENERLLKSMEMYNPARDQWTLLASDLCCGRKGMGVAVGKGCIWIAGGIVQPEKELGTYSVAYVDCYSPSEQRWSYAVSTLPSPRCYISLVNWKGHLHCLGGILRREAGTHSASAADVCVYDWETKRWKSSLNLPCPRSGGAAVTFAGNLFVIGGCDTTQGISLRSVNVLTRSAPAWTSMNPLPTNLSGLAAVSFPTDYQELSLL